MLVATLTLTAGLHAITCPSMSPGQLTSARRLPALSCEARSSFAGFEIIPSLLPFKDGIRFFEVIQVVWLGIPRRKLYLCMC
mmetsp:Transcript_15592/g.21552  ORF Transcript_15592/g.21552 Transcript_15592/m.21552 type:complete len:82 (-) Transcript_15592:206-451(-)